MDKIDPVRSKFGNIEKEEVSLEDKMSHVENYLREHKRFSFRSLLTGQKSRMHLIVTFLAILELMKIGKISAVQDGTFQDIIIEEKEQRNEE